MDKAKVCGLLVERYREENAGGSDTDLVRSIAGDDPTVVAALIMKLTGGGSNAANELIEHVADGDVSQKTTLQNALEHLMVISGTDNKLPSL